MAAGLSPCCWGTRCLRVPAPLAAPACSPGCATASAAPAAVASPQSAAWMVWAALLITPCFIYAPWL